MTWFYLFNGVIYIEEADSEELCVIAMNTHGRLDSIDLYGRRLGQSGPFSWGTVCYKRNTYTSMGNRGC